MGKLRKQGYNDGKFKEIEYFIKGLRAPIYKLLNFNSKFKFICPICNYRGPFLKKHNRPHAKCPKCGELERARFAKLLLDEIFFKEQSKKMSVLHISPENFLKKSFRKNCKHYVSADLYRTDVDCMFDIQKIPFPNESFDLIFASHVLEHVEDDYRALYEIKRVLKNKGIAILPVPLHHEKTVDFSQRPKNQRIIRETGLDYFDRYKKVFKQVDIYNSDSFESKYNLTIGIHGPKNSQLLNLIPVCKT